MTLQQVTGINNPNLVNFGNHKTFLVTKVVQN